ncbi:hypothetical protein [Pseudomonas sp. GOM6]|uniref:hypothetical protein n=1 Tax=Pseudomonas sp. GOM6 TaxID=3036944 RepID=UPI00240919DE|nr:hypothetical protein [Pseudomonas sp. GOM6]MDG1581019.1 hypothetical protein [Pseudomonas sp. GOM6]
MSTDTFYFAIHPSGDRSTIQVIDLAYAVAYERSDWMAVNGEDFTDRDEAIFHAKALAKKYGLQYLPFSSRYDKELSEPSHLNLNLD